MSIKIIQTQFFISTLCALFCLMFLNWNAIAEDTTSDADRFLKQLQGAVYRGMGGSFVGVADGANAIGNNPAGINSITGDRFVVNMTRFPHTVVLLSKTNETKKYEDYSRYEQNASGIETLNWAFPMGKLGTFGFAFSLAHEGSFRRVNHQGKAINSFPENNLAIGFGYGLNCFKGTTVGLDAKWIRSKVTDTYGTEHLGRGYAYNIGMIQRFGKALQVGLVVRNLSNGLSFIDPIVPDKIRRDVIAGVTYQYDISNLALRMGLDLHPPFTDGIRANLGTEVWYHTRIGIRIGYLRDTEKRYASVYLLEDATFEMDERTWKAEGFSFGIGVRAGSITLNGAYTPEYQPTKSDDERLHVVQGTAVYTFSIEQAF